MVRRTGSLRGALDRSGACRRFGTGRASGTRATLTAEAIEIEGLAFMVRSASVRVSAKAETAGVRRPHVTDRIHTHAQDRFSCSGDSRIGARGVPPEGGSYKSRGVPPEGGSYKSRGVPPEGGSYRSRRVPPEGGSYRSRGVPPEGGSHRSRRVPPEGGSYKSRRVPPEGGSYKSRRVPPEGGS